MSGPLDRLYRPSPELARGRALAVTLAQMSVFWATFLWLGPVLITRAERALGAPMGELPSLPVAGWSLFTVASSLGIWSAIAMSTQGLGTPLPTACAPRLVIRGPYAHVRNPMAVAGIAQGIAVGLVLGSALTVAYAFAGAVVWHVFVRPSEERDLNTRFGAAYDRYRAETPLWRPRIPRRQ